jgi:hypothetical protein
MPGYSGTPLPKKLGIKPGLRVSLFDMPADVRAELKDSLQQCKIVRGSFLDKIDFIISFAESKEDLEDLDFISTWLAPAGMLWICWPKKSSEVATDVDENVVRKIGLAAGLVDVKVCTVTEVWSGLKFVRRIKDR